jgi:hypothetical protein
MSAEEQAPPANEFENMSGNNSSGSAENASAQSGAAENASAQSGAAENASAQSGAAENASAQSGAVENASAQSGAAENASVAPPTAENNVSASPPKPPAAAPLSAPTPAPAAAPLSTSGYVMSQKAKDLQARRKALLAEMQEEYTKVFGDDKKAPKAKAYHAAGLLTIKERDGEAAYQAKLQEYIAENQRKFQGKTAKAPKGPKVSSAVSLPASAPKNATAKSGSSHSAALRSLDAMGASINTMVEKMIAKAKSLAAPAANSAHSHSSKKRKVRSNKGGTHKHKKTVAYKPYVNNS